jgi:hypothetical protein
MTHHDSTGRCGRHAEQAEADKGTTPAVLYQVAEAREHGAPGTRAAYVATPPGVLCLVAPWKHRRVRRRGRNPTLNARHGIEREAEARGQRSRCNRSGAGGNDDARMGMSRPMHPCFAVRPNVPVEGRAATAIAK